MQWKKIIKIIGIAIIVYIVFVLIEFAVMNSSFQKVTYQKSIRDSTTDAKIREMYADRQKHKTQDSLKALDSVAKR